MKPATTDALKQQYEHYQRIEANYREYLKMAKLGVAKAVRDRKAAHRQWQAKRKADAK